MADATIRGYLGSYNGGTSSMVVNVPTDGTAPVAGDWMIVIIVDTSTGTQTITPPTPPSGPGWTTLLAHTAIGSRWIQMYGKRRVAGETTYNFVASAGSAQNAAIIYGPGGVVSPSSWQLGTFTKAAASTTALALPALTTTVKSLAVALWGIGLTNAGETDAQNTVSGTGWTKDLWSAVAASGLSTNKEFIAHATQTAAGTFASPTYTRPTAGANFGGMIVAIPTLVDTIAPPTSNFTVASSNLAVTATDASTPASGQTISGVSFNWGDGTVATAGTPANHTYAAAGTYTITETTTQNDGQTATSTKNITVTAAGPHLEFLQPAGFATVTSMPITVSGTGTPGMQVELGLSSDGSYVAGASPNPTTIAADGTWSMTVTTAPPVGGNQWHSVGTVDHVNYLVVDQYFTYSPPASSGLHTLWHEQGQTALTDVILKYFDGTNTIDLSKIIPVLNGRKVSQFFDGIAVVAHRCGSVNYLEHTLRGATQSAIQGVTGLEISLGVSSDGVFFGLHDQTMDRTSPAVPSASYNPQQHTWAEIQAIPQTAPKGNNATWGNGPYNYERLETFLNAYARTHTIFIDPKYVPTAQRPALYALLNSYPNAKDTFVLKYYHTGTSIADEATAQGFKSWGYGYQSDVDGTAGTTQMSTTQAKWSWLGMDYNANAAAWATVLSYGKPVLGHIAPTAAAATTILNYGGNGIMASGVDQVMPVLSPVQVPTLNSKVTDHGKTYTWDLVQEFKTDAALGAVRTAYPSMGYFDTASQGFRDTSNQGYYAPDKVLSVSGGILQIHMHSEMINGVMTPLVSCIMPDNYKHRTYGIWEVRFRTSANKKGYKFVGIGWPNDDDWNKGEIDWPEADLTEFNRPANAKPGSLGMGNGGNPTFDPPVAHYENTGTADFHTARTVWNSDGLYFYWDGILIWGTTDTSLIPTTIMRVELQAETFIAEGTTPSDAIGDVFIDYFAAAS